MTMIYQTFNFLAGQNSTVSPFLLPENAGSVFNGCNPVYQLGALLKDVGYSLVGTQIQDNKSITGLFNFRQVPGTEKMLATVNDATDDNTQLFYKTSAGAWTEITAAETAWANVANAQVNMESFIGYCFFVGYSDVDGFLPVASLTGTTFSTSTNVTSMPQAKYIKRFRSRLYVANCKYSGTAYPFRVYFSSVPSAGAITWTPASDFIDVDFSEEITGLGEVSDRLVIFTEYSAYFYDQSTFHKVWDTGCCSHRTIVNQGPYMIWANNDGVWLSTQGGYPQEISASVRDFFKNSTTPRSWFATLVDQEYIIYVGTVAVNGVSYSNLELIYNLPTQSWRMRENGHTMTVFARYNDSGVFRRYMGDNDGNVYNKGKYSDSTILSKDNTLDIAANFELAPLNLQNAGKEKLVGAINWIAERAGGVKLKYRIIDKNARILTPYKKLGTLEKFINVFEPDIPSGLMIQFTGTQIGGTPYWSLFGYSLEFKEDTKID